VRIAVARVLGVAGLVAYNWWVWVVLFGHLLPTTDALFSDLEVVGLRDAQTFSRLDVAAGALLLAALLLRGRTGPRGARPEWPLLVVFAVAGIVGGVFPYVCAEGASAACRSAEWHFQLPFRHYLHVGAGIVEFAAVSIAALQAWRSRRDQDDPASRGVRVVGVMLVVGYPFLVVAYLTDRLGALVEPVFFVAFSLMVAVELFEPVAARRESRPPPAQSIASA
jgi:hypothetical protein